MFLFCHFVYIFRFIKRYEANDGFLHVFMYFEVCRTEAFFSFLPFNSLHKSFSSQHIDYASFLLCVAFKDV